MNAVTQHGNKTVSPNPSKEPRYLIPEVDVFENTDGFILQAEMPGVTKATLEVTLENNELTIIGRRPPEVPKMSVVFRESRPADFRRVFDLDPEIDRMKIQAEMNQGILTLRLPKAEQVKPRKITISA